MVDQDGHALEQHVPLRETSGRTRNSYFLEIAAQKNVQSLYVDIEKTCVDRHLFGADYIPELECSLLSIPEDGGSKSEEIDRRRVFFFSIKVCSHLFLHVEDTSQDLPWSHKIDEICHAISLIHAHNLESTRAKGPTILYLYMNSSPDFSLFAFAVSLDS